MPKDWEDFKRQHIDYVIISLKEKLQRIEKIIESPIERAAYVIIETYLERDYFEGKAKVEWQKKIGTYTVDFYISYNSATGPTEIIIECDGHAFHEKTKEQVTKDKKRDRYFTSRGYIVLRYSGSEIMRDPGMIGKDLYDIFNRKDGVI